MFPTPATLRWSSRNALIGARLTLVSAYRCALVNVGRERLDPKAGGEELVARRTAERQLAGAEAARVVEVELAPVAEREAHARVARRRRRVEQQRPRHAQVQHQVDVVLELPDQVLAAAVERLDAAALHGGGDLGAGERTAPALVAHLQRGQHAALDVGRQVAADRLDLGQLGHR